MIVAMYLAAIVAANLLVAQFGPAITIVNAFVFIGLDLTARDRLHEAWDKKGLMWKMAILIASGSLLSYALNRNAGTIALASFLAFALAGTADAIMYHFLKGSRMLKVNGSNVVSAGVDSFVFPAIAFGFPLLWGIMLGQFLAKVLGGYLWSEILIARRWRNRQ